MTYFLENADSKYVDQMTAKIHKTLEDLLADSKFLRLVEEHGYDQAVRELRDLDKKTQRIDGEIADQRAKLLEAEKEVASQEQKVKDATDEEDRKFQNEKAT